MTNPNSPSTLASGKSAATVKSDTETGVFAQDLMTGLMGMVPVLGGAKVAVGFAGESAFCDSTLSYVNIPALPPTRVIPITIAREIRGFAAHEAAHIAFTDPDVFPSRILDSNGHADPLLHEVWNAIEDYMIEKHWLALYPGARKNFAATENRACQSYLENHRKNPDIAKDLRSVGPVALTWMRSIFFGLGVAASRDCLATLPQSLSARVIAWFHDIRDVETTEDCLQAARDIHADILAAPHDPQNPPSYAKTPQGQQGQTPGQQGQTPGQQGQSAGQSSGQNQGGQGQNGAQGQTQPTGQQHSQATGQGQASAHTPASQGAQAGSQSGSQPGSQDSSGPGGAAGAASAPGGHAPTPLPTSHDIADIIKQADALSDTPNWINAPVLSTKTSGPQAQTLCDPAGQAAAEDIRTRLGGTICATSTQLRRALKAMAKDRWKGGRLDGRMDHRRISIAAAGGVDFFKRKVKGEKIDTAVSVLIDCSGSMDGEEIEICRDLAVILENAFQGTPIKHEIIGFTTADEAQVDDVYKTMALAHKKRGDDISLRAIGLYEFRRFDQSRHSAMRSIGNMPSVHLGQTPTSEGVLLTHDRLARRPEQRHVMFVLTDGKPDNIHATRDAVQAVEKCGVTVLGIGIGNASSAIAGIFSRHTIIQDPHDLPALMMSKLTTLLLGDKGKTALKGKAAMKKRAIS